MQADIIIPLLAGAALLAWIGRGLSWTQKLLTAAITLDQRRRRQSGQFADRSARHCLVAALIQQALDGGEDGFVRRGAGARHEATINECSFIWQAIASAHRAGVAVTDRPAAASPERCCPRAG